MIAFIISDDEEEEVGDAEKRMKPNHDKTLDKKRIQIPPRAEDDDLKEELRPSSKEDFD